MGAEEPLPTPTPALSPQALRGRWRRSDPQRVSLSSLLFQLVPRPAWGTSGPTQVGKQAPRLKSTWLQFFLLESTALGSQPTYGASYMDLGANASPPPELQFPRVSVYADCDPGACPMRMFPAVSSHKIMRALVPTPTFPSPCPW